MNDSTSGRIEVIDVLRGWAILLVVVGHAVQWTDPGFDANPVFSFIYSFHMPLFFLISGVVGEPGIRRPLLLQLRARTLGLLAPFVSWWLAAALVVWATGGRNLLESLVALYRSPDFGLWFLWVLFVITLIGAVSLRLAPGRAGWVGLAVAAVLLWAARVPVLGMGLVAWYFPFFAAGLLLSRVVRGVATTHSRRMAWAGAAALVAWVALALGWHRVDLAWPAQAWAAAGRPLPRLIDLPYRYVTAAAGIAASVLVVPRIAVAPWARGALRYLGCHTLEIYLGHALVLNLFTGAGVVWAPVAAVLALAGSLTLATVLKRIPPVRLAFYGGRT